MNYQYTKVMKRIMKKPSLILTHSMYILIICALVGIASYCYVSDKNKLEDTMVNIELFNPFDETMEFGQITPVFMSEVFASNYDDSIYYCFLLDDEYYPYIVSVYADQMDKYEDIIEYTYYDVEEPASITFTGKSTEIDSELLGFAVDAYNVFMGTDDVDENNINDQLGYYYVDTTVQPQMDYFNTILYIVIAAVIVLIYISKIIKLYKIKKCTNETLEKYNERILEEVDIEINKEQTTYFKKHQLYITDNYIVSGYRGLVIIPFNQIVQVYGVYKRANHASDNAVHVMVETQGGVHHDILYMKDTKKFEELKDKLVEEIKRRKADIEISLDDLYIDDTNIDSGIEVDKIDELSDINSNVILGIIGAIVGASIGAVAWITIGKLGYIAGLAGYLMMYLAIKGYRKLSGFLDKKGQIISIVIALFMIFFANYLSYALDYIKYYTSGTYNIANILNAFRKIPNLLTVTDGWGDFTMNLAVGYGLSIWSSFNIIKSVFTKGN